MTELLSALFGLALAWVVVSYNNQPDDELQFTHDGHKIIIINKTQENN